jgi:hypothetical protein
LLLSDLWKRIIRFLQNQQVGETVRELGLAGQNETGSQGGLLYSLSGACCVVCKVAKYLRSAFDFFWMGQ